MSSIWISGCVPRIDVYSEVMTLGVLSKGVCEYDEGCPPDSDAFRDEIIVD